jgi:hypothetical protein
MLLFLKVLEAHLLALGSILLLVPGVLGMALTLLLGLMGRATSDRLWLFEFGSRCADLLFEMKPFRGDNPLSASPAVGPVEVRCWPGEDRA